MENSLSPYHRYANTISPSPQPLSPSTPAITTQNYNIPPNNTQFVTHSMIPQFIQTNQTSPQQFNQISFTNPPTISPMRSSPTINNAEPTTSAFANITEPNVELSLLLDMDHQQFTHINSSELPSLSFLDQENMTDSFTRFQIRELNETFNNGNNSNKF